MAEQFDLSMFPDAKSVPGTPLQGGTPKFDLSLFPDENKVSKEALSTFKLVSDLDPDKEAQAQVLAKKHGLGLPLVREELDAVKQIDIHQDLSKLFDDSSALATFMTQPERAAIVKDDVQQLSMAERGWRWLKEQVNDLAENTRWGQGLTSNWKQMDELITHTPTFYDAATQAALGRGEANGGKLDEITKNMTNPVDPDGILETIGFSTANQIPIFWEMLKRGIVEGQSGGMGAALAALTLGQAGPQAALPEEILTVPGAYAAGVAVAGRTAAADTSYRIETAAAYQELRDLRDANGQRLDPAIAGRVSHVVGMINAGLEMVGFETMLHAVPGGRRVFRGALMGAVKDALKNRATIDALSIIGKEAGVAFASNALEEGLQETVNVLGEQVAKNFSERSQGTYFANIDLNAAIARVWDATVKGGAGAVGMAAPGVAARAGHVAIQTNEANKFRDRVVTTGENLEKTNTKARSPETLKQFVQVAGMDETAYIDGDALLQMGPEAAATLAEKLGLDVDATKEAAATGRDVRVQTSDLYSKLSAQEIKTLAEDIKPAPNAFTSRQAKEQNLPETIQRLAELAEDDTDFQAARQELKDQFKQAFMDRGLASTELDAAAENVAGIWERMAVGLELRGGRNAAEFLRSPDVKGKVDEVAQGILTQYQQQFGGLAQDGIDRTQTPEFKNWFGDSKVVDQQGKPLVVYHGTRAEFAAFRPDATKSEYGSFFTTSPEHASEYAGDMAEDNGRVLPVYLNITNPYEVTDAQWQNGEGLSPAEARAAGHDGYIVRGMEGGDTYIAFDPTQIKSAFNRGTFDANDPRILMQEVGDRIAAAINESNGPATADAEVAAPPQVNALYQVQNLPEWKKKTEAWMKKNGYKAKEIKQHLAAIEGQMKIFQALGPVELEMLPQGAGLNPGKGKGPIRTNADPIYKITFDASAMCVKRLEAAATANYVQAQIGRALSTSERMALVALFRAAGKAAPCVYCYVEAPRSKSGEFVKTATEVVLGAAPKDSWSQSIKDAGLAAQQEAQALGLQAGDIDPNVVLDPEYAQTPEAQAKEAAAPAVYGFLRKQMLAAKANLPKLYEEYGGQILDLPQALLDELNGYAGLRFFSSSDFQAEHVADLMQAVLDMELRQAKAHAYTKVPDFVRIFGGTGIKIQTSIFAKEEGGKIVMDDWQGMNWKDAQAFRKQYPNVGTVLVATSDKIVQWALEQPWIDYIIPFHYSGLEKKFYGTLEWQDFTSTQAEKSLEKGGEATKIRMYETGSAEGITNEQGTRNYLTLAMQRGLTPVFPAFLFKDFQPGKDRAGDAKKAVARWAEMVKRGVIDWDQINPNYYKLRKDYARTDTPFETVKASIDTAKADEVLKQFIAGETPRAQVDQQIAGKLMGMIRQAEGTDRDIGVEALKAVKMGQALFQGPQGAMQPTHDLGYFIRLFQTANLSTLLHESSHVFLMEIERVISSGQASEGLQRDYETIKRWAAKNMDKTSSTWEQLLAQHGNEKGAEWAYQQELFARAFETYLLEGKAPTVELEDAFSRFRRWLVAIYKNAAGVAAQSGMNFEMDAEIRRVFDNLLSISQEVEQASAIYEMTAMSERQMDMFGVAKEDRTYMRRLIDDAKAKGEAALLKARAKDKRGLRKTWREEITKEVEDDRVQQIVKGLRKGQGLTYDSVAENFGEEAANGLPHGVARKNGGLDIMEVAYDEGFENPEQFINALWGYRPAEEIIKEKLAQREAEYDARFKVEDFIVGTDEYAEYLAMKNRYIAQGVVGAPAGKNPKVVARALFKAAARERIYSMPLHDAMRTDLFLSAMRKANDAERKAVDSGNWAEASKANERARLNYEFAVEAAKIRGEVESLNKAAKRLAAHGKAMVKGQKAKIDQKYYMAALKVMARYGIAAPTVEIADAPPLVELLNPGDDALLELGAEFSPWLTNETDSRPLKDLSAAEMMEISDLIKYLEGTGRMLVDDKLHIKNMKMEDLRQDVISNLATLKDRKALPEKHWLRKLSDKKAKLLAENKILLQILRELDGYTALNGKPGPLENIFYDKLEEASRQKLDLKRQWAKAVEPALRQLRSSAAKFGKFENLAQNVTVPEWMKADGRTWDFETVVAVALNMGNAVNRQRLIDGYGLSDQALNELTKKLTNEDWQAIQTIGKAISDFWPHLEKVYERMNFFKPTQVEPTPFTTPTGLQMDGWYYPLRYDPANVKAGQREELNTVLNERQAAFLPSSVAKGAMMRRQASAGGMPPLLKLSVLTKHIDWAAQYSSHAEVIADLNRLLTSPKSQELRDTIKRKLGDETYKSLIQLMRNIARPDTNEAPTVVENVLYTTMNMAAVYAMNVNRMGALQQLTAIGNYVQEEGQSHGKGAMKGLAVWANGATRFLANPAEAVRLMREMSPIMADRIDDMLMKRTEYEVAKSDLGDVQVGRGDKARSMRLVKGVATRAATVMYGLFDGFISIPGWWGSYLARVEKGMDPQKAADEATKIFAAYSPLPREMDRTVSQNKRGLNIMFTFLSGWAAKYYSKSSNVYRALKAGEITPVQFMSHVLWERLLPVMVARMLANLVYGGSDDKDDDQPFWMRMLDWAMDITTFSFTGIPLARDVMNIAANGVRSGLMDENKFQRNPFQLPSGMVADLFAKTQKSLIKLIEDADDEKTRYKALLNLAELLSFGTRLPNAGKVVDDVLEGIRQAQEEDDSKAEGIAHILLRPDPKKKER